MVIEMIGRYLTTSAKSRFFISDFSVNGIAKTSPKMDYTKTELAKVINPIWNQILHNGCEKTKIVITIEKL